MKDSTARLDHRRAETETTDKSPLSGIKGAIRRSADALLRAQHADGYWCYQLEADCTIPAEYILMMHYVGEIDHEQIGRASCRERV